MAGTTSGISISKNGDNVDIVLYQGKTVNFEVIWGGDAPINVTGFSAKLHVRESAVSSAVLTEFSNTNSRIAVGGANGKFTFSMPAATSAALPVFVGVYDFEITNPSGSVFLVMSGNFKVEAEVTK